VRSGEIVEPLPFGQFLFEVGIILVREELIELFVIGSV
jgi:hypothetical protein